MDIKAAFKGNLARTLCIGAGVVLAVVGMVFSIVATANDGAVSAPVVAVTIVGAILAAATAFFDYKDLGKIAVAATYFCAFGLLISSQCGNLGYYAYGIHDIGNGLQATFIAGMIFYVLAVAAEGVALFGFTQEEKTAENQGTPAGIQK